MHKATDFISFKGGSEDAISNPRDIRFPALAAVSNFYYGLSLCPQYPVPTYSAPNFPGTIPCTTEAPVVSYDSWLQLGNYIVITNADVGGGHTHGLLAWCAPNRPDVWALTELDSGGNTVKTGAGSAQLAGGPEIVWGIGLGASGYLFSTDEIGFIGLSDRWYDPFTYVMISDQLAPLSRPLLFNRSVWIVLSDGRLYRMNGTQFAVASDFWDANATNKRWTAPTSSTKVGHSTGNIKIETSTEVCWINRTTGGYGCSGGSGGVYVTTGVLQLVPPHRRTHLIGVKVRHTYTGSGTIKVSTWGTAGFGLTESSEDSETVTLSANESFITVNRMLHEPQVKISLPTPPTTYVMYGVSFVFEDGGPRSY